MSKREYPTIDEFKKNALLFWPAELSEKEKKSSIIPKLMETQSKFISILHIADNDPTAWKSVLKQTTNMPPNLFLKHLMVLSDIGGEKTKRFKTELPNVFVDSTMDYIWDENSYTYKFKTLNDDNIKWDNKSLQVDGSGINVCAPLNSALEDVAMLLLFGSSSTNTGIPTEILDKCMIGSLLGRKNELDTFVRQRYIWVSRISGGATANRMGNLAEEYVKEQLKESLPGWDFSRKSIQGISQNEGKTDISFDIVAESPNKKLCAIELSFQVTTNSAIERKAGQAHSRWKLLHKQGHKIAYIIDGAGNFERNSALSTILKFSDCSLTFKKEEIDKFN